AHETPQQRVAHDGAVAGQEGPWLHHLGPGAVHPELPGAVNGRNMSRVTHNGVVCLVGSSVQLLQITENYCLDSENEAVPKQGHHTRCGGLALTGQCKFQVVASQ
ncbi:unnamed protein product, partial [Ixodes persulcatus]